MAIYISEKLKQFRKARDLTQEQIAEIFNVSPQSVSRWETGAGYPDMELLPSLAEFFKVTVDDLLGVDAIRKEARIREIIAQGNDDSNNDDVQIEIFRNALKEFPNNYILLMHLARVLHNKAHSFMIEEISLLRLNKPFDKDKLRDEMVKYANESIKINKQILSDWRFDLGESYSWTMQKSYEDSLATAIWSISLTYKAVLRDAEKAIEWANKIPQAGMLGRESEIIQSLKGEEKLKLFKRNLTGFSNTIKYQLSSFMDFTEESDFTKEYESLKAIVAKVELFLKNKKITYSELNDL